MTRSPESSSIDGDSVSNESFDSAKSPDKNLAKKRMPPRKGKSSKRVSTNQLINMSHQMS